MEHKYVKNLVAEIADAVEIKAWYKDFGGTLDEWKDAFYQVWRYQLTYEFAHEIKVLETRSSGVYFNIICKPCFKDDCLELLKSLKCNNIIVDPCLCGSVSAYDFPESKTPECMAVVW